MREEEAPAECLTMFIALGGNMKKFCSTIDILSKKTEGSDEGLPKSLFAIL